MNFFEYVVYRQDQIIQALVEHVELTLLAVACAVAIGVPLGLLIASVKHLNKPVIGVANVVQAVPSLAFFGFLIPLLGIGSLPTIFIVVLYALLPILKNTYTGDFITLYGVDEAEVRQLGAPYVPLRAAFRVSAVSASGVKPPAFLITSEIRSPAVASTYSPP